MRIAICDDDADFADNLRNLMEKELAALHVRPVISVYNDGTVFIADRLECDAVFLDIDMPALNGFDIAEQINHMGETLIVFVTMHDELVYSSIKFQPFRFVRKSHLADELPEVVSALSKTICKRSAGRKFEFH